MRLNLGNHTSDTRLVVRLKRCVFAQNTDIGDLNFFYGNLNGRRRGGGMYIKVENSSQEISVNVINCRFEGNNAYLGAGLSVSLRGDGSIINRVMITETEFIRNGCGENPSDLGVGGGAFISFENRKEYDKTNNEFYFINVTFERNCAALGGGIFFFSSKYATKTTGTVVFENCMWTQNAAHIGSAVALNPDVFVRAQVGHLPTPIFKSCIFEKNTIDPHLNSDKETEHNTHMQYGSGTIYSSLFSITFLETAHSINNLGSGVVVINTLADFKNSSAIFLGSTAVRGGALSLIGVSTMVIGSYKNVFENNQANDRGGAIICTTC